MTRPEWYQLLKDHGHVLHCERDGEIDIFRYDDGYHNGPECVNCDDSWCHHCQDAVKPCRGRSKTNQEIKND